MTDELERAQATGALLLRALWRDPMTKHFVVTADKSKHFFHHPIAEVDTVDDFARPHVKDSHDCYFACAEFKTHDSRKGDNAVGAWGFWMDIDCGPDKAAAGKGYGSPAEAQRALADFCLRLELPGPTHVVSSGGGLHVYWTLDARLDAHDWKRHAGQLRDLHRSLNLLADGTRTADIASLLRLPGTFNQKSAPPRPVVLLHSAAPLSRDHMVAAIESAHVKSLPSAKTSESIGGESSPERSGLPVPLDRLKQVLADLDADCIYDDWVRILMAIHNETDGSQAGLDLAIKWSSGGIKYKGPLSIQQKWLGFDSNPSRSIGMGTLVHLSKQQNDFQPVPMEIVEPVPARPPSVAINPLARYSLRGQADSLERNMVNQVAILGRIALRGQATVLYAAPGTGKTFLTIHLLCDAIERGVLEPEKLFYLNMDDNSNGLITKVRIAELHGFHMLAPGHKNFEAKLFASKLKEMTDGDTAKGVVVILDTLKKFTNLMDKGSSSEFGSLVRNFVMKGGSVIALAHTNKNPGADGKPIHAGTSDIVEDFDCAYTLAVIPVQSGEPGRGVEFANFKSRGASQSSVAYHYIPGNSYTEMMSTVREMDLLEFEPLKVAAAQAIEAPLIEAIRSCISDGIAPKMKLAIEASKRTKIGRNRIMAVIDKYTGDDIGVHFWRATTGARNAQTFECLKK